MSNERKTTARNINMKSPSSIFGDEGEQVEEISLSELVEFTNHPFKVLEDDSMEELKESIAQHGIATPIIVRKKEKGQYEIIAGHRRTMACRLLGLETIPCIIRDLDDEEATLFMVDTNIQREMLLPSEKAFAYKMKSEAVKRKNGRPEKNYSPVGHSLDKGKTTVALVSETSGESQKQVQRYIRLTELIPKFLDFVDTKKLPFQTAVELSYLSHQEQEDVAQTMDNLSVTPSLEQATKLKKYSKEGTLTPAVIDSILTESKEKPKKTTFKLDTRKYFPDKTSNKEIETLLTTLLDQWLENQQKTT